MRTDDAKYLDPEPLLQLGGSFAPGRAFATAVLPGFLSAGHKTAPARVRAAGASWSGSPGTGAAGNPAGSAERSG